MSAASAVGESGLILPANLIVIDILKTPKGVLPKFGAMYGKITRLFKSPLEYKSLPVAEPLVLSIGVDCLCKRLLGSFIFSDTFSVPPVIFAPCLAVKDY